MELTLLFRISWGLQGARLSVLRIAPLLTAMLSRIDREQVEMETMSHAIDPTGQTIIDGAATFSDANEDKLIDVSVERESTGYSRIELAATRPHSITPFGLGFSFEVWVARNVMFASSASTFGKSQLKSPPHNGG